jgi:hypothetical protein
MAIAFKAGEPTALPRSMHEEAINKGILPVEGEKASAAATQKIAGADNTTKVVMPPDSLEVREDAILEGIKAIVKRNVATDFTANGTPSATSLTAALGWKVDGKEVRKVWEKNRQQILADKDAGKE